MPPSCRLCGDGDLAPVADFGSIPIAHRPLADPRERAKLYPFSLSACLRCALVQVDTPIDPDVLYRSYNFNVSAWKFEPHLTAELDVILRRGPIDSAVDIGCNDGSFLQQLSLREVRHLVGIEPNASMAKRAQERGFSVHIAMASRDLCRAIVHQKGGRFQLVVARQVIEHIIDLDEFFACIDILLAPDGQVFLDLPDFEPSCRLGDCSTLWEEHVNYFTESVLRRLLHQHSLTVRHFDKYDFSGGCLAVLAERHGGEDDFENAQPDLRLSADFAGKAEAFRRRLAHALAAARKSGMPVVIYGSGVRACALCNILRVGEFIDYAVDDQPERQGRYIPGAGLKICAPGELARGDGSLVCLLAVNNESEERVRQRIATVTGRPIFFASVCGPRDIWRDLARLEEFVKQPVA